MRATAGGRRHIAGFGMTLLALTPLVSTVRALVAKDWLAMPLYFAGGAGIALAAWAWWSGRTTLARVGLVMSGVGLAARAAIEAPLTDGNPYFWIFLLWAMSALVGSVVTWWRPRLGASVVVAGAALAYTAYLTINVSTGITPRAVMAGLYLGLAGAGLVGWGAVGHRAVVRVSRAERSRRGAGASVFTGTK